MTMTLKDISKRMRDIDICMLTTKAASGMLVSRPMSNNREVDYDGTSCFFALGTTAVVRECEVEPTVNLALSHRQLLGKDFYLSVAGTAFLIRDRATMEQHWVKDLEIWFKDGLDTPGLTMICVKAQHLKYWNGTDQGDLKL